MKSIQENIQNEIIIKNSRFLTYLIELSSSDISPFLESIRNKNLKANHYCYAYIYENEKGCSDDGEPSRTAGAPMLNVLEREELNHVLAVTVRYFGGIKLGAGGLVRAYTKSVTEALKKASLVELIEAYKVKITFDYKDEKQINYLVGEQAILQKDYTSTPTYIVFIEKEKIHSLYPYSYEILEECYMKKDS
ncbi:MAG: YigZ family protein [Bacilli bacterium]|nr:YigZ family protein [Bacilli bacterium]